MHSVVRLERPTMEYSSSRRIRRLVPVFILEAHNQTSNKYLPKFVQTDYAYKNGQSLHSGFFPYVETKRTSWLEIDNNERKTGCIALKKEKRHFVVLERGKVQINEAPYLKIIFLKRLRCIDWRRLPRTPKAIYQICLSLI